MDIYRFTSLCWTLPLKALDDRSVVMETRRTQPAPDADVKDAKQGFGNGSIFP